MQTHLITRWGDGISNPDQARLLYALEELSTSNSEHPDAWLSDEEGWVLSIFESGLVTFKEGRTEVCRRQSVPRGEAYKLWLLLQQGRRDEIKRRLTV